MLQQLAGVLANTAGYGEVVIAEQIKGSNDIECDYKRPENGRTRTVSSAKIGE